MYEVSFDGPVVGAVTLVLTRLPAALPTIIPPPPSSASVPALVTQYITGLFLLVMESLSEKIKSERIRNIKECAGKQHLVCEPW